MKHNPLNSFFESFETIAPINSLKSLTKSIQGLIEGKLWLKVLIGLILGTALGILLGPDWNLVTPERTKVITSWLALPGNIFLRLVKMIIIPLVFSSITIGLVSSGDPEFLKKIGPRLVLYFTATTTIAIMIGFSVAFVIKPGTYINSSQIADAQDGQVETMPPISTESDIDIPDRIVQILPENPLQSMLSGEMLGVVIFTVIIGVALLVIDNKYAEPIVRLLEAVQQICMTVVRWAMELAPYAVFGLMTQITSKIGLDALAGLGMYVLAVIVGLLLLTIVYNIIIQLLTNHNPAKFMRMIKDVQVLAFSTSSSAAVMPLSIKTAEDKLNIRPTIAQFLIPVGTTINMDGTALYQAVATIFLAQVFGVELSTATLLLIVFITVGSSIGAPATPGVGVVILATILETAGIPASGIALILGVDRILDMSRTVVNVTGDLTACAFFDKNLRAVFDESQAIE
ncbi:MAG: dicarboxylate/amino acid:cation symporter [Cyclobacteriaceae bacterium]|nr:dicarboxylate/amino acid:cation symporter [Cyclobacteriaceae bacterium]